MNSSWEQHYARLAFSFDRLVRQASQGECAFVDAYYGPAELKELAPFALPSELVQQAHILEQELQTLPFAPQRLAFLQKQVKAMATLARRLNGETLSLHEEVQGLLDISVEWVPDERFDEAFSLYEQALPGKGSLGQRLLEWRRAHQLPTQHIAQLNQLLEYMQITIRQRTRALWPLPVEERLHLRLVEEKERAYHYLGNYRSRIEINKYFIPDLPRLLATLCYDGYPGRHTEAVLKEQLLYREQGQFEQCFHLRLSPQSVISQGIAMLSWEMIFAPGEIEQWLAKHIYPVLGLNTEMENIVKIWQAQDILKGVGCNAALLLQEGRSDEEVQQYMQKYQALVNLDCLKNPFLAPCIFTYYYSKQLIKPWIRQDDRQSTFRRFLTEAVCPSDLVRPTDL
ncbi:hypothetical protein [Tengunoibacter tsumagoiensis]|uniref:DUF885 domain-containing protein n=1 Tax=Tengunoibacter tsumagoiensis TaxID=2014871 RepID=A0A402A5M9_9CHLR|nr:hypothetical protein [Tengunoibacter tsumagoiensis]GCE14444.1 hypothetical protein KTT_43030 [Tengunoibacter tsumagoiensis]